MDSFEFRRNYPFKLETLEDCANAIAAVQSALPRGSYVADSLRENAIPINEMPMLQAMGETLAKACERVDQIHKTARETVLAEMKKKG